MEKIAAPSAWDISPGSSQVVVAVIDTGVDYTHPDLAANIWSNPGEIPSNGIDDDQNGYVDDLHGVNVLAGSGDPLDDNNHGTHCSGTIGGVGNNAQGVAGVNWNVQLMGVKFLASSGAGSLYGAIAGIHYAIQNGAKIISASWGGGGYSQALYDAISEAKDAGVLFVAAAGNSGLDSDVIPGYPAAYDLDNIVSVAATGKNDSLATFSNYGAKSVDIAAPGVGILSTTIGGGYEGFSGTSMATPHVAGVAALVKSVYPELDYHALKARLLDGDAIPALSGKILTGKRLNAYRALTSQAQPGSGEESPPVGGSVYISSVAGRGGQGVISRGREFTLGLTGQAGASSEINVAFRYLGISLGSCSLGTSTIGDSGTASLSGLIQTRGVLNYARSVEISTNSDALRVRIRNYAQAGKRRFSKRLVRRSVEATCEQIGASIQRF